MCIAVSDVFHTGSPDSPLWEFKHGNGSFKRGDLVGLREIKRRASRHALIHRDSFSAPKVPTGPPAGAPVEPMPDPVESRLNALEHSLYDMHARTQRSEETCIYLNQKNTFLMEGMMRCHQVGQSVETRSTQANVRGSGIMSSQIILLPWSQTRKIRFTRMVSTVPILYSNDMLTLLVSLFNATRYCSPNRDVASSRGTRGATFICTSIIFHAARQ
jgi:hypothetical protein